MKYATAIKKAQKLGIEISDAGNGCFIFKSIEPQKTGSAWLEDGVFGLVRRTYQNGENACWCNGISELFNSISRN